MSAVKERDGPGGGEGGTEKGEEEDDDDAWTAEGADRGG